MTCGVWAAACDRANLVARGRSVTRPSAYDPDPDLDTDTTRGNWGE